MVTKSVPPGCEQLWPACGSKEAPPENRGASFFAMSTGGNQILMSNSLIRSA
jgi:hypothetical protein